MSAGDGVPSASVAAPSLSAAATHVAGIASIEAGTAAPSLPTADFTVEDIRRCNIDGNVEIAFLVPPDDDYRTYLPAMGEAPELEDQSGALVVLYAGDAQLPLLAGIPDATRDALVHDAVCVLLSTGEPNVYAEVSRDGVTVPVDRYIVYVGDRGDSNPCLGWIPRQTPPPDCIVEPRP